MGRTKREFQKRKGGREKDIRKGNKTRHIEVQKKVSSSYNTSASESDRSFFSRERILYSRDVGDAMVKNVV